MFRLVIFLLSAIFTFASEPNFAKLDGTAVIYDVNASKRVIFNAERADERLNPCSTFKILNSMISLDAGAVNDENESIKYDGVTREYAAWNRDQNMREAIAVSTVWFYQELARRVGAQKMQEGVISANYGNLDSSKTLTNFWLGGGSLEISANEQVDFLTKFAKNELPFSARAIKTTKDIITLERNGDYVLQGKTGSCGGVGWFVGIRQKGDKTTVFAFNVKGKGANGVVAKQIAMEYLKSNE